MSEQIELRHMDTWKGEYRGIRFEIKHWGFGGKEEKKNWNYYLFLDERQFPEKYRSDYVLPPKKDDKGRLDYDYMSCGWNNIRAHHGWTYYKIHEGYIGTPRLIEIGCDYGHYWDEGRRYSESGILLEVQESIDDLHREVKGFLVRNQKTGEFEPEVLKDK